MTHLHYNPNKGLSFDYSPSYIQHRSKQDGKQQTAFDLAIADMKARGVTALRCERCGTEHSIYRLGQHCGKHWDDGTENGFECDGWNLTEVNPDPLPF